MRDVKLGFLLAVPAAVTILGIIWFLRKKTGKDRDGKKTKNDKETTGAQSWHKEEDKQPKCVENEGITLRQRKIPETGARERESSDGPLDSDTGTSGRTDVNRVGSVEDSSQLTNSEKEKVREIVEAAIGAGLKQATDEVLERVIVNESMEVQEDMAVCSSASVQHSMGNASDELSVKANSNNSFKGLEITSENRDSLSTVPNFHSSTCQTLSSQTSSVSSSVNNVNTASPSIDLLPHNSSPALGEQQGLCSSQSGSVSSKDIAKTQPGADLSSSLSPSDSALSHLSCSSKHSDNTASVSDVSKVRRPSEEQQGKKTEESAANSSSPVCDSNSVGSNDSGRGGSEQDSSCQNTEALVHYDFNMPSEICGRLIGRQGRNINYIKSQSGASVSLTNNPLTAEFQICQVVGTQPEVDEALAMIRRKFPLGENPRLTMTAIPLTLPKQIDPAAAVLVPDNMQLSLPDGASVEVYVSTIVDAGHVFVQQPTHRSFMALEKLNYFLNSVYSQDESIPSLPTPVECGVICVCENEGSWYRAMVMSPEDEFGECQVKFVDYGGYTQLPISCVKQIRADFMNLPFQAVECFVANISPLQGEEFFSTDATMSLSEMSQLKVLQCQVVARNELGTPYIHLYQVNADTNTATLVNRALVNQGLVRWVEIL